MKRISALIVFIILSHVGLTQTWTPKTNYGGVARGLWRALHPDGEKRLALAEIEYLIWATERLSTERIIERFNVKPKRAGTLLPGALVYLALMRKFGVAELAISEFGVREGAILNMAKGLIKGQAL